MRYIAYHPDMPNKGEKRHPAELIHLKVTYIEKDTQNREVIYCIASRIAWSKTSGLDWMIKRGIPVNVLLINLIPFRCYRSTKHCIILMYESANW